MLTNHNRAMAALRQINGYGTGDSVLHMDKLRSLVQLEQNEEELVEQWATDLLGDLRHLADEMGIEFDTWLDRAFLHYDEERSIEEAQARMPSTKQIHDALASVPALKVHTDNTGGGCMVTHVDVDNEGKYIGVTHEDTWVICYYDDGFDEGASYEVHHDLAAGDLTGMANFVGAMVLAAKVFDLSCIIQPLLEAQARQRGLARDGNILDRIQQMLTGREWHSGTIEDVAALVMESGRPIAEPEVSA